MSTQASMLLTEDELRQLTRRDRPTSQAKVLRALDIPFRKHPIDRNLLVCRSAAERALGLELPAPTDTDEPAAEWHVNVTAIRDHGKKAPTH